MKKVLISIFIILAIAFSASFVAAATITITPSNPVAGDSLTCTVGGGTTSYYYYYWYKDSVYQSAYQTNVIPASVTNANEVWQCKVYIPGNYFIGQTSVTIAPKLADLTVSCDVNPKTANIGNQINFVATANGGSGGYYYSWNFADSSLDNPNIYNPTHIYTAQGQYTASVTVTDSGSRYKKVTCPTVTINKPVVPLSATCDANPKSGNAPLNVQFTSTASGGDGKYHYTYYYGNGASTVDANNQIIYSYNIPGIFNPTVQVSDESGQSLPIDCPQINVTKPVVPLAITCSANPTSGNTPLNVHFTATATGGSGNYNYYLWEYDDSTPVPTQASITDHTYNTAGTYHPKVTVYDNNGQKANATCSESIQVTKPQTPISATCYVNPKTGDAPLNVQFTSTASGGDGKYHYTWYYGGSNYNLDIGASTTFDYTQPGTYNPQLKVYDESNNQKIVDFWGCS